MIAETLVWQWIRWRAHLRGKFLAATWGAYGRVDVVFWWDNVGLDWIGFRLLLGGVDAAACG